MSRLVLTHCGVGMLMITYEDQPGGGDDDDLVEGAISNHLICWALALLGAIYLASFVYCLRQAEHGRDDPLDVILRLIEEREWY